MRKIGFVKYKDTVKEIMPKSYQVSEKLNQRRMFFAMINEYLHKDVRIPLDNAKLFENTILNIFLSKILSNFQIYRLRPERSQRVVKVFPYESQLFQQFFKQCTRPKARYLARNWEFDQDFRVLMGFTHPIADLISMLFNGKEVSMMLDLDALFAQTIYKRIKKEPGKQVHLNTPYIHINEGGRRTRIYPRWKQVDSKNISKHAKHIDEGFKQLCADGVDAFYLVYPKTDNFKRHIRIQQDDEHEIKMIPYSFTFTNRKERKWQR
ncbi:MAG: hypothetical protein U9R50_07430 [Campylobacterota bacterium]|nr:hypothetical protein [Campylobacterota bacterium]